MPFYLRRSVSVGPFRFNLSKSGIGVSAGVRGLRIGSGPRGNYIHVGRGGLYYRASLGRSPPKRSPQKVPPIPVDARDDFEQVEGEDAPELLDSSAEHVLEQINQKLKLVEFWKVVLGFGVLAGFLALFVDLPIARSAAEAIVIACTCGAAIVAAYFDGIRRSVVILYNLEANELGAFKQFVEQFDKLASSQSTWNVEAQARNADWKRSGGATTSVKRQNAFLGLRSPPVVRTNISIPAVVGGKWNVYFFPDVILIMNGKAAGIVEYKNLAVNFRETQFIESGRVPSDALVVDRTWQYVNRDGSPDRRFNGNRQLPIALYQEVRFSAENGFDKLLHLSKLQDTDQFITCVSALADIAGRIRTEDDPTVSPAISSAPIAPVGDENGVDRGHRRDTPTAWPWKSVLLVLCLGAVAIAVTSIASTREKMNAVQRANDRHDKAAATTENSLAKPKIGRSDSVLAIQKRLSALGYDPGSIDGVMGGRTTKAIQSFQSRNGLTPTGTINDAFLDRLYQGND